MVRVLISSAIDCGLEPQLGQTKDYEIGICFFSTKHATLGERTKTDWIKILIMCWSVATVTRGMF